MQKKSLLVALFCGALCLTGCLKNEESASVTQVRTAKANELNSIATLNEAKAAAELIYANADATLKGAEAELKKAEAALVLAMAETEKVRAELLKTQVALQEVKVEEEGIELLKKAAELEILVAQAEVAQAKAEADKQYWANKLEQLIADAEVAAVENGLELMKAQDAVEAYILTMEGAKADSAKVYAQKYFKAQNKLVELQAAELAARAARVLIENNAMATREWIHSEIEKKNDSIDVNNARIEALKEYQTVDPETAQAELEAAWKEYNETYTAWKVATEAETKAQAEYDNEEAKKADFNNERYVPAGTGSTWYTDFKQYIQPIFKAAKMYDETVPFKVTVGETTITLPAGETGGIYVPSETEGGEPEFVPFWHNEGTAKVASRYPDIYVSAYKPYTPSEGVKKTPLDYVILENTLIAPATIYYANIDKALTKVVAAYKEDLNESVNDFEEDLTDAIEGTEDIVGLEEKVAGMNNVLTLHKEYLKARKAKVEEAEEAYIAEVKKVEKYNTDKEAAWKAFEDYMVVKYDVTRELFMKRLEADTTEQRASRDTLKWFEAKEGALDGFDEIYEDVLDAFEAYADAEGALRLAEYVAAKDPDAIEAKKLITTAEQKWHQDFADAVADGGKPVMEHKYWAEGHNPEAPYYDPIPQVDKKKVHWIIEGSEIGAGSAQDSVLTYSYNLELAAEVKYYAYVNTLRFPDGYESAVEKETYEYWDDIYDDASHLWEALDNALNTKTTGHADKQKSAKKAYDTAVAAYQPFQDDIDDAKKAYNPDFNIFTVASFPTTAKPNVDWTCKSRQYLNRKGEWVINGKKAGTAQADLLDEVLIATRTVNYAKRAESNYETAKGKWETAYHNLLDADMDLMEALGADVRGIHSYKAKAAFVEEHLKDYIDHEAEEKYQAYLDIQPNAHINRARIALWSAYSYNPDELGKLQMKNGKKVEPDEDVYGFGFGKQSWKKAQFGWLRSSYEVDYTATYVNDEGKRVPIAEFFYGNKPADMEKEYAQVFTAKYNSVNLGTTNIKMITKFYPEVTKEYYGEDGKVVDDPDDAATHPVYSKSLAFKIDEMQEWIDAKPALIKAAKAIAKESGDGFQDILDSYKAKVNAYKTYEGDYTKWVEKREKAEAKLNQAKKDAFDAKLKKEAAQVKFEAAEAAANQYVYMYSPKIYDEATGKWIPNTAEDKFVKVSINEAIKMIEAENEGIEARKHELELDLKYGKLTYQTVMEVLDETIEVLSADIEIWAAIANKYRVIMNGYLGIVEEGDVAEPVEAEGDEE